MAMLNKEEWVKEAKKDFSKFKSNKEFSVEDEGRLLSDVTALLGWLNVDNDSEIQSLIEQIIAFGEKQGWDMSGPRIAFDHIKEKHKKS